MQLKLINRTCLAAVVVVCLCVLKPSTATAQITDGAISAYSPYTMFGIGEIQTPGNIQNRAMGGIGVALRSSLQVSLLNPAGLSAMGRKQFLFDFSVEGNFLKNRQNFEGQTLKNVKNTINIHSVMVQMPLAKRLGLGISVNPYSSVGYQMQTLEDSEDIWGSVGLAGYGYKGSGDVTEVKASIGWEPFKNFSIGFAGKYFWGNIKREYASVAMSDVVGSGHFVSVSGTNEASISSFKFQAGVQWNIISTAKRLLTVGATYDYGGAMKPKISNVILLGGSTATLVSDTDKVGEFRLPHAVAAGITYQNPRLVVGFDYERQNWDTNLPENIYDGENNGLQVRYTNTNTYKLGIEITPNAFDVRHYLSRVHYRFGFRYGNYYQTFNDRGINQYAVTAGFGFPIKFLGSSSLNVALEYGARASLNKKIRDDISFIRQDYFKISFGITLFGEDYWFVRPKFD